MGRGGAPITVPAYSASYGSFSFGDITPPTFYGTAGTLVGITATTTATSTSVTSMTVGHGLAIGDYVTIGANAAAFRLTAVGASTATLNRAATATGAGTVQFIRLPDPQTSWGYNLNRISNPTEPEFVWKIEADFLDADGYRKLESYLQYSDDGVAVARPFFASVNRDTNRLQEVILNGGTLGLTVIGGIGDGASDGGILRARQSAGNPQTMFGDWAAFDALGLVHRSLHVSGNDIVNIAASTLNKKLINIAAYDGGGTPYVQIYGYDYVASGGLPLKLNQYGGAVTIGDTLAVTGALAVNGATVAAKPTVTGSRGGNAALADLLTKLAAMGFFTDGTS